MSRVIDVFMLGSELDMLEGRLREFEGRDVVHVLAEAPVTHTGAPKPLHYADNRERFSAWSDRIVHVVADGLDPAMDPWPREHAQRDAALPAVAEIAQPGDMVLVADVDEFPPWPLPPHRLKAAFRQRLAMYAVDWLYPEPQLCLVAGRWDVIRAGGSLAAFRDGRYGYPVCDGGMHLTWLGGPEGQRAKLATTCHAEMTDLSKELLGSGRCWREGFHHSGDIMMVPADADESWPGFICRRECPANWFRPREETCA